jgi:hypothetical protein
MTLVSNPHDKLFKQIWSDRETAADFLANYLPRDFSGDMQSDFRTVLNSMKLGFRGVDDPDAVGFYPDISDNKKEFHRKGAKKRSNEQCGAGNKPGETIILRNRMR